MTTATATATVTAVTTPPPPTTTRIIITYPYNCFQRVAKHKLGFAEMSKEKFSSNFPRISSYNWSYCVLDLKMIPQLNAKTRPGFSPFEKKKKPLPSVLKIGWQEPHIEIQKLCFLIEAKSYQLTSSITLYMFDITDITDMLWYDIYACIY